MSDAKTIQRQVRPVTIACGGRECPTKPIDAILEEHADGSSEILAPRGWVFPKNPKASGNVYVGTCPAHEVKG
jgi:hypothetical protein